MRVVLDTNVLISALLFGGELEFITDALKHGKVVPCFSNATFAELGRTLRYPKFADIFKDAELDIDDVLMRLTLQSVHVPDTKPPVPIPKDRADEAIIACAFAAQAMAIVTRDKLLLSLKDKVAIPVMTPSDFKSVLVLYDKSS